MTNQETKEFFQRELEYVKPFREQYKGAKSLCEAFENAINALEQQPSEDCVSRAEMLKYQQYLYGKMPNEENQKLWEFIKALPPVTPTRKSGLHWIERFDNEDKWLECPQCHKDSDNAYNYCPNCGADMRGNNVD